DRGARSAADEPRAERGGDPHRARRGSLPLHGLPRSRRGGARRGRADAIRPNGAMMHEMKRPPIFAYGYKPEMERAELARIPIEPYVSEEFYRRECRTIWRRCWLWAGRADEIPNPGDYFVFNLPFLDRTSILVVRGKDGVIRGFYNACQHRGARLAYYE